MDNPFVEQLLSGSGPLYLALGALTLAALVVRAFSSDEHTRRRALFVVGLLLLFALLQITLGQIPERTSGFVTTPAGQRVPGLVPNPIYELVGVAALIVGLLALLLAGMLLFIDIFLVRQLHFEVPNILRDVTASALFFVGVLLILYYRTDLDLSGLFTTSAVLSIVIGLALQDTLGNLFSGLALQTERSFNVGDWVRFGEREGVVTDISWRATKLRTRSNDLVIIPNSVISKDTLINYSVPTRVHAVYGRVGVHYRHPPADVIAALEEAADQTEGVLKRPRADVRTVEFGDFAITYLIKYWIRDYADLEDISNYFMTRVWYSFSRRGIEIPFPIRNVYMRQVTPETIAAEEAADDERIYQHLRGADIFEALTETEARSLAARARREQYFVGETVLQQGDPGDSLYIIDAGRVEVVVSHDGRSEKIAELGPTAFIGEMALMTGAERTATVRAVQPTHFFVVDREAFRQTLQSNPRLADEISGILAQRQRELEETHAALDRAAAATEEEEKRQILSRIWDFFGFRGSAEEIS